MDDIAKLKKENVMLHGLLDDLQKMFDAAGIPNDPEGNTLLRAEIALGVPAPTYRDEPNPLGEHDHLLDGDPTTY